jgi:hypothetical protein
MWWFANISADDVQDLVISRIAQLFMPRNRQHREAGLLNTPTNS